MPMLQEWELLQVDWRLAHSALAEAPNSLQERQLEPVPALELAGEEVAQE